MSNLSIWKWTLEITDLQDVTLPKGSYLLTIQMQDGKPQLWALCDPLQAPATRSIAIYVTGNPVPNDAGDYIATFQMAGGVWHAFEVIRYEGERI